jgi:hypothetical protein
MHENQERIAGETQEILRVADDKEMLQRIYITLAMFVATLFAVVALQLIGILLPLLIFVGIILYNYFSGEDVTQTLNRPGFEGNKTGPPQICPECRFTNKSANTKYIHCGAILHRKNHEN